MLYNSNKKLKRAISDAKRLVDVARGAGLVSRRQGERDAAGGLGQEANNNADQQREEAAAPAPASARAASSSSGGGQPPRGQARGEDEETVDLALNKITPVGSSTGSTGPGTPDEPASPADSDDVSDQPTVPLGGDTDDHNVVEDNAPRGNDRKDAAPASSSSSHNTQDKDLIDLEERLKKNTDDDTTTTTVKQHKNKDAEGGSPAAVVVAVVDAVVDAEGQQKKKSTDDKKRGASQRKTQRRHAKRPKRVLSADEINEAQRIADELDATIGTSPFLSFFLSRGATSSTDAGTKA
mmetsp:Transcript_8086/g.26558  ORF Transcript_8086/g.26558 Transcript_8086/m.26558 type:complete len:295 (+) Transcript_8086:463-1347(+)